MHKALVNKPQRRSKKGTDDEIRFINEDIGYLLLLAISWSVPFLRDKIKSLIR